MYNKNDGILGAEWMSKECEVNDMDAYVWVKDDGGDVVVLLWLYLPFVMFRGYGAKNLRL